MFFFFFIVDMNDKIIEEIFLDQILDDIQRIDRTKCISIGKNLIEISFLVFNNSIS